MAATSFTEADTVTHTYTNADGTTTINVTASNGLSTVNEQNTTTVEIPINRPAYDVTSNSPQTHPCQPSSTCTTPGKSVCLRFDTPVEEIKSILYKMACDIHT